MSTEELIRGFFSFLISGILAYGLFMHYEQESGEKDERRSGSRYSTFVDPLLLPSLLLFIFAAYLWMTRGDLPKVLEALFQSCFSIFLEIGIYFLLLLLALPILRKRLYARTCAALWIIPNFLYLVMYSWMHLPSPGWVLWLPGNWLTMSACVWGIGFLAVMLWKSIGHLIFRRKLLRRARPVKDPSVLALWQQEQQDMQIRKAPYRLVISPDTVTPLSIGLFKRTMRVVLPDRSYTQEELSFIFRHELIHIVHQDSRTKLFLTFCTAMCWFLPLMWIAMRRSAEDLELCCDEFVLLHADEADRHTYAELILTAAADERGYTTCLSASASSLRYRLKNILKPGRRFTGCFFLGLIFFLLMMAAGRVAAAYPGGRGADLIFQGEISPARLSSCSFYDSTDGGTSSQFVRVDEDALTAYLSDLSLYHLTGSYTFSDSEEEMTAVYDYGDSLLGVVLWDRSIKIVPFNDESVSYYYLKEPVDWAYIESLVKS